MRKQSYRFLLLSIIFSTVLAVSSSYGARHYRQQCDESPGADDKYRCASDLTCTKGWCDYKSYLTGSEKECRDKIRAKAGDDKITPSHHDDYCYHKCEVIGELAGDIRSKKNKLEEIKKTQQKILNFRQNVPDSLKILSSKIVISLFFETIEKLNSLRSDIQEYLKTAETEKNKIYSKEDLEIIDKVIKYRKNMHKRVFLRDLYNITKYGRLRAFESDIESEDITKSEDITRLCEHF